VNHRKPSPDRDRLTSADGVLSFSLARGRRGLHVMREEKLDRESTLTQSVMFGSLEGFRDWLEADDKLVAYPTIATAVAQRASAILAAEEPA
jgi:hypothetical protein